MRALHTKMTANGLLALALFTVTAGGQAQPGSVPGYSRYSPIYELARRLEARYAKAVTVEGPLIVWPGELERAGFTRNGVERFDPRPYTLFLPASDPVLNASAISVGLVRNALDVYYRQNPDRTRYQVLEFSMGFHIVPVTAHDEAGSCIP
jgi:hypothetical protein